MLNLKFVLTKFKQRFVKKRYVLKSFFKKNRIYKLFIWNPQWRRKSFRRSNLDENEKEIILGFVFLFEKNYVEQNF